MKTRRAPHVPGEEGIWVFIFGDLLVFGLFFVTFVYYRGLDTALYDSSQDVLNRTFGLINTMFLLTSSWFVALAVRCAHLGRRRWIPALLVGGIICGVSFVVIKAFEYGEKISAGITLTTNEFFIFYYMLTGIHLLHVLLGLCILSYLFIRSRAEESGADYVAVMEGGGVFWHLVDLLWIVLFALLYLLR